MRRTSIATSEKVTRRHSRKLSYFARFMSIVGGLILLSVCVAQQPSQRDQPDPQPAVIDAERAYGYLKQICDFGPRKAGSEANAKQRKLVADHFKANGATLTEQKFKGTDLLDRRHPVQVEMVNLIGSWFPDRTDRVVIAAHYDTRPFPDLDPNPAQRRAAFIGANDGASGVAVLMEIANHLNNMKTPWGVDLVLFDGEELVYEYPNGTRDGKFFLGSIEFSRLYKARRSKPGGYHYRAGFLLDMVGGKNMTIAKEPFSMKLGGSFLIPEIWDIAKRLEANAFVNRVGRAVEDDHKPMNDAGIPTIDIIDFEYTPWHTANDIPEQCSADSLYQVARVITAWLNQPKRPAKAKTKRK